MYIEVFYQIDKKSIKKYMMYINFKIRAFVVTLPIINFCKYRDSSFPDNPWKENEPTKDAGYKKSYGSRRNPVYEKGLGTNNFQIIPRPSIGYSQGTGNYYTAPPGREDSIASRDNTQITEYNKLPEVDYAYVKQDDGRLYSVISDQETRSNVGSFFI